jgi:hypothetical protein
MVWLTALAVQPSNRASTDAGSVEKGWLTVGGLALQSCFHRRRVSGAAAVPKFAEY